MHRRTFIRTAAALGGATVAGACARLGGSGGDETLVAVAAAAGLDEFLSAARAAGLDGLLAGSTALTVFAPTDAAFDALDPELRARLATPEGQRELRGVVAGHILPAAYDSAALAAREGDYVTAAGTRVTIAGGAGALAVDGARVLGPALAADNGFLFTLDRVLLPG